MKELIIQELIKLTYTVPSIKSAKYEFDSNCNVIRIKEINNIPLTLKFTSGGMSVVLGLGQDSDSMSTILFQANVKDKDLIDLIVLITQMISRHKIGYNSGSTTFRFLYKQL